MADVEKVPFQRLVELHNTVELVANDYWRRNFKTEIGLVEAIVRGYVEDLTPKGWKMVVFLLKDIESVSPLTMLNPANLPIIT
jgi:hypothetical protein